MPRSPSGTMSLSTGNPVVTHTTVSSTVYNATTTDIASELTDSLSRSGKGAMSAPLQIASGSVTAPGLAFSSNTNDGLYRIGAHDMGVAINGTKVLEVTANVGLTVTGGTGGIVATASSGNNHGIDTTGKGTGAGLHATGGDGNGAGLYAMGTGTGVGADLTGGGVNSGGTNVNAAVNSHGNIVMSGTAPASTTAFSNTLTPRNMIACWVDMSLDGSRAITVNDGFNLTSAGQSGAANTVIQLTFAKAMASAFYVVLGNLHNSGVIHSINVTSQSTASVSFTILNSASSIIDLASQRLKVLIVGLTS